LFEIFEAVPAVVLGLIAAITLAPWLARHVLGAVAFLVLTPFALALAGMAWQSFAPVAWQRRFEGREPWLAVPVVVVVFVLALPLGAMFASVLPAAVSEPATPWNALLVGLVLALSVMPTMFSLAEDALFAVPAGLADGAYALGATRWQALVSLVLRAASPGLVAALLLGFSRALGETMIVLMASGNTPVASADPLAGLRSIAANLALEAPEAMPGGAHYRTLLTSALLLFGACFALTSVAEAVRAQLRRRYAAL
jgi:phosphate transport system permease protein